MPPTAYYLFRITDDFYGTHWIIAESFGRALDIVIDLVRKASGAGDTHLKTLSCIKEAEIDYTPLAGKACVLSSPFKARAQPDGDEDE